MNEYHLLDGTLGRNFLYWGMALWLSPLVWKWFVKQPLNRQPWARTMIAVGLAVYALGASLQINAAVLMAMDAEAVASQGAPELEWFARGLNPFLRTTFFGRFWGLEAVAGLIAGGLWVSTRWWPGALNWMWAPTTVSLYSTALTGHASATGPLGDEAAYHFLHSGAAVLWASGLIAILGARCLPPFRLRWADLEEFSRFAILIFCVLFVSGALKAVRLGPTLLRDFSHGAFFWLLAIKLGLTLSVLGLAAKLRQRVHAPRKGSLKSFFDVAFSWEVFLATLIFLASSLLSQLDPAQRF